jgi:hypothetical protein
MKDGKRQAKRQEAVAKGKSPSGPSGYQEVGCAVAYLRAADNYDGPLAIRLKGCHQPVIRTPNAFSTPRSTRLAGI